jgi:hypothetical protein
MHVHRHRVRVGIRPPWPVHRCTSTWNQYFVQRPPAAGRWPPRNVETTALNRIALKPYDFQPYPHGVHACTPASSAPSKPALMPCTSVYIHMESIFCSAAAGRWPPRNVETTPLNRIALKPVDFQPYPHGVHACTPASSAPSKPALMPCTSVYICSLELELPFRARIPAVGNCGSKEAQSLKKAPFYRHGVHLCTPVYTRD